MQNLRRQFDKENERDSIDLLMTKDFLDVFETEHTTIETDKTVTIIVPIERVNKYDQFYTKHRLVDNYGFYPYESDESTGERESV